MLPEISFVSAGYLSLCTLQLSQNIIQCHLWNSSPELLSYNKISVFFFSSPEQKAHGELIVYQSSRRPSDRACVHTFKH